MPRSFEVKLRSVLTEQQAIALDLEAINAHSIYITELQGEGSARKFVVRAVHFRKETSLEEAAKAIRAFFDRIGFPVLNVLVQTKPIDERGITITSIG